MRWLFSLLHTIQKDLKFSSFTELGQDLIYLAHVGQAKKFNCILFSWGSDINIPSPIVEILTLWSPHKLLKNLGSLSEYAKCSQMFDQNKKNEILTLNPGYNAMVKKLSHATVPLSPIVQ
jgi:hypothetical protein